MNYKSVVEHYINSVGYDASEEDKQCIMNIILYEKNKSVKEIIDKLIGSHKKIDIYNIDHQYVLSKKNMQEVLIKATPHF